MTDQPEQVEGKRVAQDEQGRVFIDGELVAHIADLPPDLGKAWGILQARIEALTAENERLRALLKAETGGYWS